jgi:hypothetical protein
MTARYTEPGVRRVINLRTVIPTPFVKAIERLAGVSSSQEGRAVYDLSDGWRCTGSRRSGPAFTGPRAPLVRGNAVSPQLSQDGSGG